MGADTTPAPLQSVVRRLEQMPLRTRLVAILLVLLLTALTLASLASVALLDRDLRNRVDAELRSAAEPVGEQAYQDANAGAIRRFPSQYAVIFLRPGGAGSVASWPDSAPVEARPQLPDLSVTDVARFKGRPFTLESADDEHAWRVVAGTIDGGEGGIFLVGLPLDNTEDTVRRLMALTWLIGLGVLVACAVLGWWAVRRAFRPLRKIEDTAAAIAGGDLTRRIPTRASDDEVASLSDSLNAMLQQIERSFAVREASEERMRQFVADASHELRTPLATVRGYAELHRQGAITGDDQVAAAMGRIEGEARRMGGLVEDLLLLARMDDQRPLERQPLDLVVLGADAVADARVRDPEREISLRPLVGELGPTPVIGDEASLRQVLGNLMTNAIRHTPAGTPIEVAVGTRGEWGLVEVRDHGTGIDPAVRERVFERFFRSDPARSRSNGGTGLGLAIVAAITGRHGGRVDLTDTPGGGSTFVIALPSGSSQVEHSAP
ncbi:sensor histidine kinase [Janibacter sp. G1551]|uniref:sensor histidine kinase n=1 Tax=Janibacter sp. G1551 TaxID=3420440 RepID=UPI003D00B009